MPLNSPQFHRRDRIRTCNPRFWRPVHHRCATRLTKSNQRQKPPARIGLATSSLPRRRSATELRGHLSHQLSARPCWNRRFWCTGTDSNRRTPKRSDLQSDAFNHSATCASCLGLSSKSRRQDLNPRPAVYKTAALPLSYTGVLSRAAKRNYRAPNFPRQRLSPKYLELLPNPLTHSARAHQHLYH